MPYESMDRPDKAIYKYTSGIDCNKAGKNRGNAEPV
jgi:hypothetical protein